MIFSKHKNWSVFSDLIFSKLKTDLYFSDMIFSKHKNWYVFFKSDFFLVQKLICIF